jgi:hypothetical protein
MVFWIFGKGFGTLGVNMKQDRVIGTEPEFGQNVEDPQALFARVKEGLVLCLCAGEGDGSLLPGLPGDGAVANTVSVRRRRASVVLVFCPVRVGETGAG